MAFSTLPRIVLGEILQRFLGESEFFLGFHFVVSLNRFGGSILVKVIACLRCWFIAAAMTSA